MLRSENTSALASFIFEDILCRWGALAEIVTDNGPAFVQALNVLANRYNIRHNASPPITPRLTVWSSGVTLMSRRPSSKAPQGGSSAGIPPLTRSFGPST